LVSVGKACRDFEKFRQKDRSDDPSGPTLGPEDVQPRSMK